ncbi:S9 family peptidase [Flavivirga sp. 57AJ16]|uniref:alpha/beta hydrolase family protein n=1 Tax=Flavivirga sp. 57AJ16 TaxID=3025307 RepID=UPI0023670C86|nr:prolyl oligopeptidase family serine peptidase [Flavivirga sp. 57AJ16]MDD7888228.1 prolyl oligopeptidase family serine peptidase [Flavivirga sp. 57AJ16]
MMAIKFSVKIYRGMYNQNTALCFLNKKCGYIFLFILMLSAYPSWGQATPKKKLTPNDYHRWSTLFIPQISDDGQWVSYTKQYDYGQDTLFISSTDGNTKYFYPGDGFLKFSPKGSKALVLDNSVLQIQDLLDGTVEKVPSVLSYEMIQDGVSVLIRKVGDKNSGQHLSIKHLNTGNTYDLTEVNIYTISSKGNKLLYSKRIGESYNLYLLDMASHPYQPVLLRTSVEPFKKLTWGSSGNSFAFLEQESSSVNNLDLCFYKIDDQQWFRLNQESIFYKDSQLKLADYRLVIAPDDSKVLFGVKPLVGNNQIKDDLVEIWHGKDKIIHPRRESLGLVGDQVRDWMWWPKKQKAIKLETKNHPESVPAPDFNYAVVYNLWDNEPRFKRDFEMNIYIKELPSGKNHLLAENIESYGGRYIKFSDDARFIKYFKNGHWWVYNTKNQSYVNLTENLDGRFSFLDYGNVEDEVPYGSPGWNHELNMVLIYDEYDLWQVSLDGKRSKRLTNGREKGIRYRVCDATFEPSTAGYFSNFTDNRLDVDKGLVLEAQGDDISSGYFYLDPDKGLQALVYGPKRVYNLKRAKNSQDYIYLEESFEEPTRLVHFKKGNTPNTIANPNAFQFKYAWGRSKLINYQNKNGENIQGVLIYPSDYEPGQTYPMVVHIYEEQKHKLHKAVIPSEYDKLNPTVFAANGYFFLYPDIKYDIGSPGNSALDCVTSAVNKVVDMGLVDPKRVGLYGASFGGFETTYIISQTDIFATAIAGVAVTDFVRSYLSISESEDWDNAWRYEHHQFRMGKSFTENFKNFIDNSPIHHVHSINTPLLGWVGKADRNVHWTQSVELYLALRRLKKEHILLVYPKEKHSIRDKEKQKDLAQRVNEWLDHYLKRYPKKEWMEKGWKE